MKLFQRDVYKTKNDRKIKVDRWTCPVCDGPARPDDLYVDGFWQEILNDTQTNEADHVFIFPNCRYVVEEIELQEQSDSDSECGGTQKAVAKPKAPGKDAVISLLSDDEDEAPPATVVTSKDTSR